jgi:hypothetical protein
MHFETPLLIDKVAGHGVEQLEDRNLCLHGEELPYLELPIIELYDSLVSSGPR